MTVETFVQTVRDALTPLADAQRATGMHAYMREQFDFLGISAVPRRQATAHLVRAKHPPEELIESALSLWTLPQREYQYIALDLLNPPPLMGGGLPLSCWHASFFCVQW